VATPPHPAALIDSDVLIDAARGHFEATAFLNAQNRAFRVQISTVSAMELIVGCRNKIELSQTRRFLEPVRILPIDPNISDNAYHLIQEFTLSHGLMIPDALIAATALENGLTLLTKNTRHFQMIPKLEVVRPY
jgi:predicted nucleic acid-binding protein